MTTALSLAENITQAPMAPIDEFGAIARMMEIDGQSVETIALTFGTTLVALNPGQKAEDRGITVMRVADPAKRTAKT